MKNQKKIIFVFAILFVFIAKVNAVEDKFVLDLDLTKSTVTFNKEYLGNSNVVYKDGFVSFTSNYQNEAVAATTEVFYYSKTGELIKSLVLDDRMIIEAVADARYVYALAYQQSSQSLSVIKLDDNLNIVASAVVPEGFVQDDKLINVISSNYGISLMSIVDDQVNILGKNILQYDLNLGNVKVLEATENYVKKYFLELYQLLTRSSVEKRKYVSLALNEKYMVYSGVNNCKNSWAEYFYNFPWLKMNDSEVCNDSFYLVLSDRENKIIWDKEITDYDSIYDINIIDDYIVAIGLKGSLTSIVVYDLEGNLVQEISQNSVYNKIIPFSKKIIVNQNIENKNNCRLVDSFNGEGLKNVNFINGEVSQENTCAVESHASIYSLSYTINKIIEGNGTIEVVESIKAGEKVTFKANPDRGYEIAAIRVTDKNGKTIEQKDGTFVMPESDVTIEVIFKEIVSNPNTTDYGIFFLVGVAIIFGVMMYITSKKLYFLR